MSNPHSMVPLRADVREARLAEYQKWDYITLSDFHSNSCGTFLSYGWLWFLTIVAIAVYGSDTFTAVSLLAFNRWSNTFTPVVPLDISRWIFSGCILLSWILLGYDWIRAIRVIRRGNVAESYLDPLAVVVQSMRVNKTGQGWRRFLVFKTLTKSKKGADYIAIFTYFQFKGAIRLLIAEGPRQVINGLTLYSLLRADLSVGANGAAEGHPSFAQFWINVKKLYESSPEQAIIMFTMLFTLIIWIFSALSFIAACALYVGFLLHYIPREEGGLNNYCRRKVDKRLSRVMNEQAKTAIDRDERRRKRDEEKYAGTKLAPPSRAPTLPSLADSSAKTPSLFHTNSVSSQDPSLNLPGKDGVVATVREATLPDLEENDSSWVRQPTLPQIEDMADSVAQRPVRPRAPIRSGTQSSGVSVSSFSSDRPLLQNASRMNGSVSPMGRSLDHVHSFGQDGRPGTGYERSQDWLVQRADSNLSRSSNKPLPTGISRKPAPIRSNTGGSALSYAPSSLSSKPSIAQSYQSSISDARRPAAGLRNPSDMSSSPMAFGQDELGYEMQPSNVAQRPSPPRQESFTAYSPYRPQTPSKELRTITNPQWQPASRAMTASPLAMNRNEAGVASMALRRTAMPPLQRDTRSGEGGSQVQREYNGQHSSEE